MTLGIGSPAAARPAKGWHPDVWALSVALDQCWARLPRSTGPGRLLEGLRAWVRFQGRQQRPGTPWWQQTLALVSAAAAAIDEPGTTMLLRPWLADAQRGTFRPGEGL